MSEEDWLCVWSCGSHWIYCGGKEDRQLGEVDTSKAEAFLIVRMYFNNIHTVNTEVLREKLRSSFNEQLMWNESLHINGAFQLQCGGSWYIWMRPSHTAGMVQLRDNWKMPDQSLIGVFLKKHAAFPPILLLVMSSSRAKATIVLQLCTTLSCCL